MEYKLFKKEQKTHHDEINKLDKLINEIKNEIDEDTALLNKMTPTQIYHPDHNHRKLEQIVDNKKHKYELMNDLIKELVRIIILENNDIIDYENTIKLRDIYQKLIDNLFILYPNRIYPYDYRNMLKSLDFNNFTIKDLTIYTTIFITFNRVLYNRISLNSNTKRNKIRNMILQEIKNSSIKIQIC